MFLGYQINKDGQEFIASVRETKEELENIPLVSFSRIEETEDTYVLYQGKWIKEADKTILENEQLSAEKRAERDEAINAIIWRVQRYEQQKLLGIETTDSEQVYMNVLEYIQYLRDIPNTLSFPDVAVMSFEEWNKSVDV